MTVRRTLDKGINVSPQQFIGYVFSRCQVSSIHICSFFHHFICLFVSFQEPLFVCSFLMAFFSIPVRCAFTCITSRSRSLTARSVHNSQVVIHRSASFCFGPMYPSSLSSTAHQYCPYGQLPFGQLHRGAPSVCPFFPRKPQRWPCFSQSVW